MSVNKGNDWNTLIMTGALHRAKMDSAPRTLSDWNAKQKSKGLTALRYLIVDDDPAERSVIREALLTFALRDFIETETVREALYFLGKRHIDAVVVNMSMKDRGGIEFAKRVRRGGVTKNPLVPIIAILPEHCKITAKQAYRSGIDGIVPKPLCPNILIENIKRSVLLFGPDKVAC